MPENLSSRRFQYADNTALAVQSTDFKTCKDKLNEELNTLLKYYNMWKLKPNPAKTESIMFHLNNRLANQKLNINFDGIQVQHKMAPKYLRVNLDRSLTYRAHLERIALKLLTRNNIITKLAGSRWGANDNSFRTATFALVYSTAKYCCHVMLNSCHVSKIDMQLNRSMRIIFRTLKSTPLLWLPVLINIPSPHIRREVFLWENGRNTLKLLPYRYMMI